MLYNIETFICVLFSNTRSDANNQTRAMFVQNARMQTTKHKSMHESSLCTMSLAPHVRANIAPSNN